MPQGSSWSRPKAILFSWLIVGTLDICAAMIQTALAGGTQMKLFQYIASGIWGPSAFEGGSEIAVLGLLLHYGIALAWTALFFLTYPSLTFAPFHRVLTGFSYGLVVWFVMNRVVLPLSQVPQRPFDWGRSAVSAAVLIFAIGLPLSFLAHRFYSKAEIE